MPNHDRISIEPDTMKPADSTRTLRKGLTFMVATCLVATLGYRLAGWNWVDSFYMVTITIFGVGYGEVNTIDETWLKLFTIVFIFAGCSSLIYVIGGIVQMLTEGEIKRMLGNMQQTREIDQLSEHTIICGYGRVGQMLASELQSQGESLVILDRNPDRVELALEDGFLAMAGDAVRDEVLQKVGLLRARTFATVLPDDAANVFITLTARDLNESIQIIARAESPCTERKLIRSGATHVVIPAAIGAVRIAQLAMTQNHDESLPESRFRMLSATAASYSDGDVCPIEGASKEVLEEVEELAHLATDVSRSAVERHRKFLINQEKQDHPEATT